jgi:molybdopterin-guanine dinucleotide biosynthesis protein A
MPAFDAVVLAGGRAERAGGIDKPGERVGGRSLLMSVVTAAVDAGASTVVVVGPPRAVLRRPASLARRIEQTCEDPPGSGPVPALRAGLARVGEPVVAVLAADLPFLAARHLLPLLVVTSAGNTGTGSTGAVMIDDTGRRQWLAGCWRVPVLRPALAGYAGQSLHGLLAPLLPAMIRFHQSPGEPPPWLDCDTAEDLALARRMRTGRAPAAAE